MKVTHAKDALGEFFQYAEEELDRIVGRLCRRDPVLSLYANYGGGRTRYTVVDLANGCERMLPLTEQETAVRFAVAFVAKHPEAMLDGSFGGFASSPHEFSVRVPEPGLANVIPLPVRGATG